MTRALLAMALVVAAAAPAAAHDAGFRTELGGAAVILDDTKSPTLSLMGECKYARYAVGLGGGGVTFTLVGAGTAIGAYQGIPVVATGVVCRLIKPEATYVSGPDYLPGPLSETDLTFDTWNASGGMVCVTVHALLRQVPPGEPDALITSKEACR